MKRHESLVITIIVLVICLMSVPILSQSPQSISYQAIVRGSDGNPMTNQQVSIQIKLHQGNASGTVVYCETHSVTTNPLGLVTIEIGTGVVVLGSFQDIPWETGQYFLELELDPSGGTTYVPMGTTQLLSVPYALFSEKSGQTYSAGTGIDITDVTITNTAPDQTVTLTGTGGTNVTGIYPSFTINSPEVTTYVGGTGINITGNTITNIDPDQIVNLNNGTGINVAGAYPNFTLNNTLADQTVVLNAGIGINTSGTYPSFTISNTAPDQVVNLSSGTGIAVSGNYPNYTVSNTSPNINHSGDALGSNALTVVQIQGKPVSSATPTMDQVLQWNGSQWSPATFAAGSPGWSLTGNSGTNPTINFLGTTDNQPLKFKVNNIFAGEINPVTNNTFLGMQAGNNSTGYSNTASGSWALNSNTTGYNNTASGYCALVANTIGYFNTADGYSALFYNKANYGSTAIGYQAMYYADNRETGRETFNTALGYEALKGSSTPANNTGQGNTALGVLALYANTSGYYNTASGLWALPNNMTGYENTADGVGALYSNTSGYLNTAIGVGALNINSTGSHNTAVGKSALVNNTLGSYSTALGQNALSSADNTYLTGLGHNANVSSADIYNSSVMGDAAIVNANNKIRIGDASMIVIEGQVDWSFPSDGRFKKNESEDVQGLSFIRLLRPVVYNFDTRKYTEFLTKNMPDSLQYEYLNTKDFSTSTAIRHSGFVAQDVVKAAAACGYDFNGVHVPVDDNDNYSIAYGQFVVPLVKAVQEQQAMIETLHKMNEAQQKAIEALQAEVKMMHDQFTK